MADPGAIARTPRASTGRSATPGATPVRRGSTGRSAARFAARFEALADAVVAPEPPLPPVAATDAAAAFATALDHGPRLNALGARLLLAGVAIAARLRTRTAWHELDRGRRLALLRAAERRAPARAALEAVRAAAAMSYYGDAGVLRALEGQP